MRVERCLEVNDVACALDHLGVRGGGLGCGVECLGCRVEGGGFEDLLKSEAWV